MWPGESIQFYCRNGLNCLGDSRLRNITKDVELNMNRVLFNIDIKRTKYNYEVQICKE